MGNTASSNAFAASVLPAQSKLPCTFPDDSCLDDILKEGRQDKKRKRQSRSGEGSGSFHIGQNAQAKKKVHLQEDPNAPADENTGLQHVACLSRMRAPDAPAQPKEGFSLERDFTKVRKLGESTEGKVYLMKSKKSEQAELFALKVLKKKPRSQNVADIPEELLLHLNTRMHPHIAFCSQIDIVDGSIWQCLEFCNGSDLISYCEKRRGISDVGHRIFMVHVLIQLSEAFAYLHYNLRREAASGWVSDGEREPIIFGDCKPENILLHFCPANEYNTYPEIRLADFGHATVASRPYRIAGSELFLCPECKAADEGLAGPRMSTASDIYIFGLTMFFLISGQHWRTGANPKYLKLPNEYNELGFTRILQHCLAVNPKARPTMNCHGGHGLLNAVDEAWKVRDDMFRRHGHIDSPFWAKWRKEAINTQTGGLNQVVSTTKSLFVSETL